jgi:hypothetical protein
VRTRVAAAGAKYHAPRRRATSLACQNPHSPNPPLAPFPLPKQHGRSVQSARCSAPDLIARHTLAGNQP